MVVSGLQGLEARGEEKEVLSDCPAMGGDGRRSPVCDCLVAADGGGSPEVSRASNPGEPQRRGLSRGGGDSGNGYGRGGTAFGGRATGTRAKGRSRTAGTNKGQGEGKREGDGWGERNPTQSEERRERGNGQVGQVEEQLASKAAGKRHHGVNERSDKGKRGMEGPGSSWPQRLQERGITA